MSEWKTYKLADLYSVPSKNGLMKPSAIRGSGYKMVNMKEIFSYDRMFNIPMERVPISEKEESFFLERGDLLFARQSLVISGAGKCSIFLHDNEPVVFESHLIRTRFDKMLIDTNYLYYYFKSPIGRNKIESIVEFTAAAGIRGSDLSKIEITVPDLSAQTQIAQILTSLDDKIELNIQMNQTLEAMAQTIFKEWFVNFKFPGFDGELVNGLPKGWRNGNFEELTNIKTGKGLKRAEFKSDGIYPVIGANGELGRTDEYLLDDKLLLTGRVGTLGSIKISYGKKWYSDNVLIMKPYEYFYFTYFNLKAIDMNSLNRGSTQPLVTQTDIKNYLTLIPDEEILLLFEKTVYEIFEKIFFNDIQIQTLTQTRDNLLPRLMSGKIKIEK
jgi:type I restriction enzyme S subunit